MKKTNRRRNNSVKLDKKALMRCGPGIRRLLQLKTEEIVRAKKMDELRLQKFFEHTKIDSKKSRVSPKKAFFHRYTPRAHSHRIFGSVIVDKPKKEPVKVRAIIEFAGNSDDLTSLGIGVHANVQNVFTITATKKQLSTLTSQAATQKIRLPRLFFPNLQDSVPTAEVDQIHAVGNRGNGTIVGVIDSPLHVGHHAFREPVGANNTRVQYYWVQDPDPFPGGVIPAGAQTPEQYFNDNVNHPNSPDFTGLNYGILYDADYINAALTGGGNLYGTGVGEIAKDPTTESEHGTHVAGIAAGSGHLNNWAQGVNIGAAPLADIVHVCYRWSYANLQDGIWEDDVINALDFILRIADAENRSVVINCSFGTNVGPHNGRNAFDQARNAMLDSTQGRSIVFAAGNDNNDEGFRRGTVTNNSTDSFDVHPLFASNPDIWVDIWYKGPDLDFKMDCGGSTTGWVSSPNDFTGNVNGYDIEVDRDVEPASGMKSIRLYIESANADWTINLRNPSTTTDVNYWVWVGGQGNWADLDGFSIDEMTLSDTSCARALLTVGSCAKQIGGNPEEIADYSGRGPTLDGRIKPEIAAVGGSYLFGNPLTQIQSADSMTNGGYIGKMGTSMAAPLVAGAIALLLEDQPILNQDAIKGLLTQNADRTNLDIDPLAVGYDKFERNAYGYGRLRMLAPFQFIQPPGDVDVWVRTADDDYGLEPYPGGCFCHAPEVKVLDSSNNETTSLLWGQEHTVKVRIHNLGDSDALNTKIKLKYTRPWAAPDDWKPCQDSSNQPIEQTVTVPALSYIDVIFTQLWKPELAELPAGGAEWGDHYCLLVDVEHNSDPLLYDDSTAAGSEAWTKNIKGTNNVALRNLHIH